MCGTLRLMSGTIWHLGSENYSREVGLGEVLKVRQGVGMWTARGRDSW